MAFDLKAANEEAKARLVPALRGRGAHLGLAEAVRDFPGELMNEKPANVPYTFWHMLEHIRIAQWDLMRYASDSEHVSPEWPRGYWPAPDDVTDEAGWDATVAAIRADRDELIGVIEDPACNVLEPVAHMDGRSIMRAALLVIDHTAYHLGEFVMARQMAGAWESELEG
ncbi:MAG: DinB family protein [Spirochaetota bacterium]